MKDIYLRQLQSKDLQSYEYWHHPSREYHKFNGPYYKKKTEEEIHQQIKEWQKSLEKGDASFLEQSLIICDKLTDDIIGEVNYYWKSIETNWLEIGIVIFNENYWGMGIGYSALSLWISHLFDKMPKLVRIGLTTWSGNLRMMHLAEKLKMKKEANFRMARIVNNQYYNSVSYGILRSEWNP